MQYCAELDKSGFTDMEEKVQDIASLKGVGVGVGGERGIMAAEPNMYSVNLFFVNRIHQNELLERSKLNRDRRNCGRFFAFHSLSVLFEHFMNMCCFCH